ncbi:alpha/beta hydrolase [Geitlerinema sp. PCC 9228]|jgi:hypothetical protein|uniref:alpha/beta hydrolase n=1 Tax=Geitlerinema sp. PCC 9228 TaxID=111611 RepID=UPI0008F9E1A5|nr:alpha/beta hydrolase [Geitlerinema sp. PCC 9228]
MQFFKQRKQPSWVRQKSRTIGAIALAIVAFATTVALTIFPSDRGVASERLVITYGAINRSIEISEIATLVETGEASTGLQDIIRVADIDKETMRKIFAKEVDADLQFLDNSLNHPLGEFVLFNIGNVVHPKSREAEIQALRAAIVLSASDDGKISLLEFLQKYPTPDIYLDAQRLLELSQDLDFVSAGFQKALNFVRDSMLYDLICPPSQTS